MKPTADPLSGVSITNTRCNLIPKDQVAIYRWPGNHLNVLSPKKLTNKQLFSVVSQFLAAEIEHKAKQEAAK